MHFLSNSTMYLMAIFLPSFGAMLLLWPGWRKAVITWMPWTALPAVLLAVAGETGGRITLPWLFFNARFGLDATAQVFLGFTALVWLLAAVYAGGYIKHDDPHRARFFASFLLAMSGNFGLILAEDVFSFYFLFALMSFASFGLVAHTGSPAARRAGQVYIALVVIGEAFVFSALLLAAQTTGTVHLTEMAAGVAESPARNQILALAFIGFGVKAGALPLHVWLPLAHPVAPTPASAVLSGCMIKAGLLG
ncbi:MAG: NADH-ubiquinone oxidoreductase, partial [Candidatus Omnitrophica bacterium]|nr:NADH-ubiquinone oxidoreductase [Candidatus Omnitrophota bacterium]